MSTYGLPRSYRFQKLWVHHLAQRAAGPVAISAHSEIRLFQPVWPPTSLTSLGVHVWKYAINQQHGCQKIYPNQQILPTKVWIGFLNKEVYTIYLYTYLLQIYIYITYVPPPKKCPVNINRYIYIYIINVDIISQFYSPSHLWSFSQWWPFFPPPAVASIGGFKASRSERGQRVQPGRQPEARVRFGMVWVVNPRSSFPYHPCIWYIEIIYLHVLEFYGKCR